MIRHLANLPSVKRRRAVYWAMNLVFALALIAFSLRGCG